MNSFIAYFRLHEQSVHEGSLQLDYTVSVRPTTFLCRVTCCAFSKVERCFLQSLSAPYPNETRTNSWKGGTFPAYSGAHLWLQNFRLACARSSRGGLDCSRMATESERKELFISYGREPEVIQFVTRLKGDLENHGFSVWMDVHDISAGSDWHGAIGTGLTQCRAIVPIITSKYIGSRYCTNEVRCVFVHRERGGGGGGGGGGKCVDVYNGGGVYACVCVCVCACLYMQGLSCECAYVSACVFEHMWYGWKTPLTNYLIGCFCTQLYTADGDKKTIFPIMFEDVDFSTNELARGVKFVISGVNWTMCRPGVDDYNSSISKLMQGMKEKGRLCIPDTKQK